MDNYTQVQRFFYEVSIEMKKKLPGCTFDYQPFYIKSHMRTETPTVFVSKDGMNIGSFTLDKDQCSPLRYFSYYTGVSGGRGINGHKPTVEEVVDTFVLMVKLTNMRSEAKALVKEGERLGLSESAITFYFPSK